MQKPTKTGFFWRITRFAPELFISTSNFQMSLNALICMASYYFHVYSVSCDVHFRYNDDAFMWTA